MASLHDITVGQDIELKRVLAHAGMTGEMVEAILKNPKLAGEMIQALSLKLAPPTLSTFTKPVGVFEAFVIRARARRWPVVDEQLVQLRDQAVAVGDFESSLSGAFSLDIWLGSVERTVSELWLWISEVHPHWKWDGLEFGRKKLRLTEAVFNSGRYRNGAYNAFVRPVVIDLNANRGKVPRDVRDARSAGFEIMTAFAVHPGYPSQINYETISGARLGALEATVPDRERWRSVPVLYWHRDYRLVSFDARSDDNANPLYAVPTVREL